MDFIHPDFGLWKIRYNPMTPVSCSKKGMNTIEANNNIT